MAQIKTKSIIKTKYKNGKAETKTTIFTDYDFKGMTKNDLKNMLYDACYNYYEIDRNTKREIYTDKEIKKRLQNMLDFQSYILTLFEDYEYYTQNKNNADITFKLRPTKKKQKMQQSTKK